MVTGTNSVFSVRRQQRGRTVHLYLTGELDLAGSAVLEGALSKERAGNTDLVIDLEDVTFMDSSGLRSLLKEHNATVRGGSRFVIVKAPAVVRRLLTITGAMSLLGVDDSILMARGDPAFHITDVMS